MTEAQTWIGPLLGILTAAIIPLLGWAFRLQLRNAALESRVKSLEDARNQDLKEIKEIASGQTQILLKLEAVIVELRLTRKGAQ